MCRVMSALNFSLLSAIQRRGVTPLVTLKNFSGARRVRWQFSLKAVQILADQRRPDRIRPSPVRTLAESIGFKSRRAHH